MSNRPYIGNAPTTTPIQTSDLASGIVTPPKLANSVTPTAGQIPSYPTGGANFVWTDYTRPPLNVNPNWLLDQINEGALYTCGTTLGNGPDGWTPWIAGGMPGVFKVRTVADPDNATLKCLEITCTTADATISAGDAYYLETVVEGYDAAALAPGVSSASQITVQFKFKTSVTGTYGLSVSNSAQNRSYVGTITVPDTAENSYSVTLTLDTSGTWLYTNGAGLRFRLALAMGSTYQTSAGSWQAGQFFATSSQANFMSANTNVAYLKRFHVIPGGVALAYHPQDIQRELAKGQRYYAKTFTQGTAVAQGINAGALMGRGSASSDSEPFVNWQFPVVMRATPTTTLYAPGGGGTASQWGNGGGLSCANSRAGGIGANDREVQIDNAGNVSGTAGAQWYIHATANARLS